MIVAPEGDLKPSTLPKVFNGWVQSSSRDLFAVRTPAGRRRTVLTERMATLTVLLGLTIVFATIHPVLDPDMWWHLSVGEAILQSRSVHFVDPFSFTNPKVWVNSQWLTEAVFAALNRFFGVAGLEALALLLKVVAFLLVFKAFRAANLTRVWVTILFAFGALSVTGGVRPQLMSFLFLAWVALTIHQQRQGANSQSEGQWRFAGLPMFVSMPLLFALWANIHSFYPIAFALLILAIFADYANERLGLKPVLGTKWRKQMALTVFLCAVAVMLTPFGWHSPKQVVVNIVQSSQLPIEEWKPTMAMRHPIVVIWAILLLLWLVCLAWSPKRPDALELLWGGFATFNALTGVRMVALWCLLLAPFVGEHIGRWISQIPRSQLAANRTVPSWVPATVVILFAFAAGLIVSLRFSPSEFAKRERKGYPQRAVAWLRERGLTGNCLARYDWGGYVAWQLGGRMRVFVDGRADFYPMKVLRDFVAAYYGRSNWYQVLNRYGVTVVIVPPDAPIANLLLLRSSEWRCVYRDETALVFIRRALVSSPPSRPTKLQRATSRTAATPLQTAAKR